MSNISGKLNLMQLKAAIRKMNGANGPIDCIVIPIEANHLFRGEQGVYLDLIAFESKTKNEKIKDTHLVKQSLQKEVLEAMSDEEKKSQPIIGNLRVWGEYQESAPQSDMTVGDEKDDLPF
jgi:predicted ATP-grasp superfamily ATP-dependent carboligase